MAEISIPGVTDKYNTTSLIEGLMKTERVPLTREQNNLETYKTQEESWRRVNQQMASLRETARSLYSYDNPFTSKIAESTDSSSVTAEAARDASFDSFKITVKNIATTDRFMSKNLDKNTIVAAGKYTFTVSDKNVSMNWKGGKLSDFAAAINRRSNGIVKASLIGVSDGKQAFLIESLKTGEQNKLQFSDDAFQFALDNEIIQKKTGGANTFGINQTELSTSKLDNQIISNGIPYSGTASIIDDKVQVPPQTGTVIAVPSKVSNDSSQRIEFNITLEQTDDITTDINSQSSQPILPAPQRIDYNGITVFNDASETGLSKTATTQETVEPISTVNILYVRNADGSETPINQLKNTSESQSISLKIADYPGITGIVIKNENTGKNVVIDSIHSFDIATDLGYEPVNPISVASDANITYEGIPISRSDNKIDDIIPNVTLNLYSESEKPVTISIKPDEETAKDSLISLVGQYNKLMGELNILTQNKPEIITELDYLTDDEVKTAEKNLGSFQTDFTLTNGRTQLQRIMASNYPSTEDAQFTMLSQLGISTNASGSGSGYSASQLRGYLEIDEKKLDSVLKDNMSPLKNLFGYDSDGDLIIDSGIAYTLDKTLQSYVQTGGILANKTSAVKSKITTSESKIKELETQLAEKEQDLKTQYGNMESTLQSLESQSSSITNSLNQKTAASK